MLEFLQARLQVHHPNTLEERLNRYILGHLTDKVDVFHSATATYCAPSDPSSQKGMRQEYIRSTPSWCHKGERRDCVLVSVSSDDGELEKLEVARVFLFFSLKFRGKIIPCALVQWVPRVDTIPDTVTGMWIVRPERLPGG